MSGYRDSRLVSTETVGGTLPLKRLEPRRLCQRGALHASWPRRCTGTSAWGVQGAQPSQRRDTRREGPVQIIELQRPAARRRCVADEARTTRDAHHERITARRKAGRGTYSLVSAVSLEMVKGTLPNRLPPNKSLQLWPSRRRLDSGSTRCRE
jgi:hypothetical protein